MPEIILTQGQVCELLRVSRPTVIRYQGKGLPMISRGKYDAGAVVAWLVDYKVSNQFDVRGHIVDKDDDVDKRLTIARAEKVERENDIANKELISRERYHGFVGYIGTIVANAFESLGARLCNQIAALDDPAEIQKLIWVESRDTRTQIATKAEEMELDLVQELTVDP